jgi:hypothetical protein
MIEDDSVQTVIGNIELTCLRKKCGYYAFAKNVMFINLDLCITDISDLYVVPLA